MTDAIAIAAGHSHACAVLANSTVRCWGNNGAGRLGDGTNNDSLVPVTVKRVITIPGLTGPVSRLIDLSNMVAVAAGNSHTCALSAGGQPVCWGSNGNGRLGDGTTMSRETATPVPSFSFNVDRLAELKGHGHMALVTALVNCEAGQRVRIEVTLTQAGRSSQGHAAGRCTGRLEGYAVTIPARGRHGFQLGSATAQAEAVIEAQGQILQTEEWTREVELAVEP